MKFLIWPLPVLLGFLAVGGSGEEPAAVAPQPAASGAARSRLDQVMTSRFCADCHPAIFAEHAQNTHGRAFTDEEVRLATGRFDHGDCIRCHTPRPVFETGIGMNPMRRFHNLEEGNTCMTCHWKPGYDYAAFHGGKECSAAFDDRVGEVESCASCHRNHGTPYQWEIAPTGKLAGNTCVDCHMARVMRPVAVGEEPRLVRTHVFPGSRSLTQLDRAYRYDAAIDGNEVVVTITNHGAGHHFPTELKQRSVESLIIVRDLDGSEVSRSRMVFRDPYKRPYGLTLPVNTQIPPAQSREHRVPIKVANGTVDCELHFKLYYPIEDHHPDLARLLESKRLVFDAITPSVKDVMTDPEVHVVTPESVSPELASPANLVDFSHPPIGTVEVSIPEGQDEASIRRLIELLQFPVPEANGIAVRRLVAIGEPAIPLLVEAMGSWDNKTWNQAMVALARIGEPAVPAVVAALRSDQLYVRVNARELLGRMGWLGREEDAIAALLAGLTADNALDRTSCADLLGRLRIGDARDALIGCLQDRDPDVVRSAALALTRLHARQAVPALRAALDCATFPETRMDLAACLLRLGDDQAIHTLLVGLDHPDDLVREKYFETFFGLTRMHLGYEPLMPYADRLAALSRLFAEVARAGVVIEPFPPADPDLNARAWDLVQKIGGEADDAAMLDELVGMGTDAVPALLLGLKFPPGYADKRVLVCEALGRIASPQAAPALAGALRDPVIAVAAWACWALEQIGDEQTRAAITRYRDRLLTLRANAAIPPSAGSADLLLVQAARARFAVGDASARDELVSGLLSADDNARRLAIDALEQRFGETRGYDPEASLGERRTAAAAWMR